MSNALEQNKKKKNNKERDCTTQLDCEMKTSTTRYIFRNKFSSARGRLAN